MGEVKDTQHIAQVIIIIINVGMYEVVPRPGSWKLLHVDKTYITGLMIRDHAILLPNNVCSPKLLLAMNKVWFINEVMYV